MSSARLELQPPQKAKPVIHINISEYWKINVIYLVYFYTLSSVDLYVCVDIAVQYVLERLDIKLDSITNIFMYR